MRGWGAPAPTNGLLEEPVSHVLDLFAANLGERSDCVTARIGRSLYVRFSDDTGVLKISDTHGRDEVKVTLQLIHPEHGLIDTASFTHTRAQRTSDALERLDAFMEIWF